MNKQWFKRLLLSYLPIFFVITSLLLLIAILTASKLSQKATEEANTASARHAMALLDNTLKAVDDAILKEIQTNAVLGQFFYPPPGGNPFYSVYEPSSLLRNIITGVQSIRIDSIYLYRISDGVVLTANTILPLDLFGDKAFIDKLRSQAPADIWTSERSYKEFIDQEASASVVSLVRKVPPIAGGQGFVVVNVRTGDISHMIESIMNSSYSYAVLRDRKGASLMTAQMQGAMANLDKLEEEDPHAAVIRSDYTGWEIRSGLTHTSLFNFITGFSQLLLGIGALAIVLGIVAIIVITRRNYRPIESVLTRLRSISLEKANELMPAAGRDEFKFIEAALDDMLEQSHQFRERQKEDLFFRRQYFFEEWMEGNRTIAESEWHGEMRRLGLKDSFERLQAAVIELDKYEQFCREYSYRDQYLLKFIIGSVIREIVPQEQAHIWTEWLDNHRLTVLYQWLGADETNKPDDRDEAYRYGEKLQAWVIENLKFTVTIGIGPQVRQIEEAADSYAGALEAVKYKSVLGSSRVIAHDEIEGTPLGETYAHLQLIRSLSQAYRLGDDQWLDQYETLFRSIRDLLFSRDDLLSLINYLVYHLQREMMELPPEYQDIWNNGAFDSLHAALKQFDTIQELDREFRRILLETAATMKRLRESRSHHSMIREVRAYIERHFANPDLSLNHLSEAFNMNPKYVSQLFKDEFGVKFVDYLAQLRIEHAKKRLLESEDPVQDIASSVGYMHSFSFIRLFKKAVGLTPGDYRKEYG
ncbi:helix-turn-helix domain-containing protein [Paenibacillus spongiae]|uniref:Helix-turn-helix domain-containing protein n=1 Tax=Paenibacillus spongiae TaxID=2909671 RepID=A0ABY5SEC3_9BACL|nr:helix-turn-helix domain-containing protein [Paenibacillus spongiae]UVI31994.1 helix-turn-helix domain-containing protein [Paenibacillus spongiae]